MAYLSHAARGASPISDEACSRAVRESSMRNHLLTAGALVIALAGFAASGANAESPPTLPGTDYVVPVERANQGSRADAGDLAYWHSDNSSAALGPDDGPESFWRRPYASSDDEVSELQRLFPSSPWRQSMRE
jgi:hypothetical protein